MSATSAASWLMQTAVGGGLLLLFARLAMARTPAPAVRQRLGEMGVLAALLLATATWAPAWLAVGLPAWLAPDRLAPAGPGEVSALPAPAWPGPPDAPADELAGPPLPPPAADGRAPAEPSPAKAGGEPLPWRPWVEAVVVTAYACVAGLFLARWLFAHAALAWLLRGAAPAPAWVAGVLAETPAPAPTRLLVSSRVRAPFSFGLVRPTVVLPTALLSAPPQAVRWVLAHEASHLRRRDGWAAVLLAVGQSAFFYVPWFWWLRRQVRLCQEQVADEAALAAGGRAADYAEFLLGWARATPSAALGVSGNSSDLYRRVSRLLRPPAPPVRPGRWWASAACWLALAVVLPALHVRPRAAAAPPAPGPVAAPPGGEDDRVRELRAEVEALRRLAERQAEQLRQEIGRRPPPAIFAGSAVEEQAGRLGVRVRPPEPALVAQLGLPAGQGVVVVQVRDGSPAARAGLRAHDVLLAVGGRPVPAGLAGFAGLVAGADPGRRVGVVVVRKRKRVTLPGLVLPGAGAWVSLEPWNGGTGS
jgi:hypothetical protein